MEDNVAHFGKFDGDVTLVTAPTLTFGTCYICGKAGADEYDSCGYVIHAACKTCPACGEEVFVVWRNVKPMYFRCLKCLHGWEAQNG